MTLQDLGSIGEMIGAIGVVVTLLYLTKQIRLNTIAMEEARKLALAQMYQMRSDALQSMMVNAADSDRIGPVIIKLTELGYPEDPEALQQLTADEPGLLPPVADRAADALGQHAFPVSARLPGRRVVREFVQGAREAPCADVAGAGAHRGAAQLSGRDRTAGARTQVGFGERAWHDSRGRCDHTANGEFTRMTRRTPRRRSAFRPITSCCWRCSASRRCTKVLMRRC